MLAQLSDYLQQQSTYHLAIPVNASKVDLAIGARNVSVSNISTQSVGYGSSSIRVLQAGHHSVPVIRLPSFIPVQSQIADMTFTHIPSPVLRMMGSSPLLWSDLPLQATTEKLIDNIPTAWKN